MGIYTIGIGGTGSKCVEAIIQMAAVGLFDKEPIKVLFLDADDTNGNLTRSRTSLTVYQECYKFMGEGDKDQCPLMKTKIDTFGLWSPFAQQNFDKELKTFFNYNTIEQNQPELAHLFDVLYTKEEREANLDVGFRGRPAIGSAVMSQVDLDNLNEEPWSSLIKEIQQDTGLGKKPKVFLCGSIFGGTGASGLPTIARLLDNKLKRLNLRDRVEIGCLFVLPYFAFSPEPGQNPNEIYARSDQFLLNTEAALRYYVTQGQEIFDRVYLLGNQNFTPVKFSIGKNSQRNHAHFMELYGALAARQFLLEPSTGNNKVMLMSRQNLGKLIWGDLSKQAVVKEYLANATRFAYTWLAEIRPEIATASKMQEGGRFGRLIPWMTKFYHNGRNGLPALDDPNERKAIEAIDSWCKVYLRWLSEIHQCEGDAIELFNAKAFANPDGELKGEELVELVKKGLDSQGGSQRQKTIKLKQMKEGLDPKKVSGSDQGTVGLAKTVYISCKIR